METSVGATGKWPPKNAIFHAAFCIVTRGSCSHSNSHLKFDFS